MNDEGQMTRSFVTNAQNFKVLSFGFISAVHIRASSSAFENLGSAMLPWRKQLKGLVRASLALQ
jgi:hypothetical protein